MNGGVRRVLSAKWLLSVLFVARFPHARQRVVTMTGYSGFGATTPSCAAVSWFGAVSLPSWQAHCWRLRLPGAGFCSFGQCWLFAAPCAFCVFSGLLRILSSITPCYVVKRAHTHSFFGCTPACGQVGEGRVCLCGKSWGAKGVLGVCTTLHVVSSRADVVWGFIRNLPWVS